MDSIINNTLIKLKNKQPSMNKIRRHMSKPELGYINNEKGVISINNNTSEDDLIVAYSSLDRNIFYDLIAPYYFAFEVYNNELIGWHSDFKNFWLNLMASCAESASLNVWFVSDDMKHVYVLHNHIRTTYMIGRINPKHELTSICLRKFKKARLTP